MEKLPEKFRKNGYEYRLIKRNDLVAMYAMVWINEETGEERVHCYEVFLIKVQKPRFVEFPDGGVVKYHAKEKLPSNESFGYTAWAPATVERAEELFEQLTEKADKAKV